MNTVIYQQIGQPRRNKFLEIYNLPKLSYEKTENLNRSITSKDTESVIKNLPINKSPGADGFTDKFHQTFKEELKPVFLKLFQKIEGGEHFQPHFKRAAVSWYQSEPKTQ